MLSFYPGMFFSNEDLTLDPLKTQANPEDTMLRERSQASNVAYYDPVCMKPPKEANSASQGRLAVARSQGRAACRPCSCTPGFSGGGKTSWNWNMVKTDLRKPLLSCSHRRESCMVGAIWFLRTLIVKEGKQKRRNTGCSANAGWG